MIQLMYLLVGWHYVKQGFGVLTVLSARRKVRVSARERVAFLFHAMRGGRTRGRAPRCPRASSKKKASSIPRSRIRAGSSSRRAPSSRRARSRSCSCSLVEAAKARTVLAARAGDRAAHHGVVWTIYSSIDPVMRYLIPALHSIQYLYFVWLMRRNEARAFEGPPTSASPPPCASDFSR